MGDGGRTEGSMRGPHVGTEKEAEGAGPPSLCCSEGPLWAAEPLESSQDSELQKKIHHPGAPWAPPSAAPPTCWHTPSPRARPLAAPSPPTSLPRTHTPSRSARPGPAPQLSINHSVQRALEHPQQHHRDASAPLK